jgi:hypothetical protein
MDQPRIADFGAAQSKRLVAMAILENGQIRIAYLLVLHQIHPPEIKRTLGAERCEYGSLETCRPP